MRDVVPYKGRGGEARYSGVIIAAARFVGMVLILCAVCAFTYFLWRFMAGDESVPASGVGAQSGPIIVIDAGHGGIDSGAVAADGTEEKNLNLSIAQKLAALCSAAGIECVQTRTGDFMLVDESVTSHRKMHDLKNRLGVATEIKDSGREVILVSIHMNKFTSPKYSGLQVWYSKNDESSAGMASYIQGYAKTWLDSGNNRETKGATSSIYLLDRADFTAVLVECGFLSNVAECEKLKTEKYQKEVAMTVFSALCEYLSRK